MDDEKSSLDLLRGLEDPAAIFDEPEEILQRSGVPRDVKIALLHRWERLVSAQPDPATTPTSEGEPPLLGRIIRALNALLHDRMLDAEEGRRRNGNGQGCG